MADPAREGAGPVVAEAVTVNQASENERKTHDGREIFTLYIEISLGNELGGCDVCNHEGEGAQGRTERGASAPRKHY